jgi:hypothetical protein
VGPGPVGASVRNSEATCGRSEKPQCRNSEAHLWQVGEKASSRVPWNQAIPLAPWWSRGSWRPLALGGLVGALAKGGWVAADHSDLGPGTGSSLRFLQPVRARVAVRTAAAIHMGFMASPAFAPCSAGARC